MERHVAISRRNCSDLDYCRVMAFKLRSTNELLTFKAQPELDEMKIMVKSNVTLKVFFDLQVLLASQDAEKMQEGFESFATDVLQSWDVTDDDGTSIPTDSDGFGQLPFTLALAVLTAWVEQVSSSGEVSRLTRNGFSPSAAEAIGTVSQ